MGCKKQWYHNVTVRPVGTESVFRVASVGKDERHFEQGDSQAALHSTTTTAESLLSSVCGTYVLEDVSSMMASAAEAV